jgi:hypothetical protein
MSRYLMAVLVSSVFALGSVSINASSAAAGDVEPALGRNPSPLMAGSAAGIREAQGLVVTPLIAGLTVAGIFTAGVLVIGDNTDDDSGTTTTTTTTTGTN